MVCIDRCGFCKHYIGLSNGEYGLILCAAFPDGQPPKFMEEEGKECANGYHFELNPDKAQDYHEEWYVHPVSQNDANFKPIIIGNVTVE